MRADEVDAARRRHGPDRRCARAGPRAICPAHGAARGDPRRSGRARTRGRGREVRTSSRVEVPRRAADADGSSSSPCRPRSPPACSASRRPGRGTPRSSASICSSTAASCGTPLAALLGSDAHWVFDRGALTGRRPTGRPVPDRRLERGPRADGASRPELVDLMARQLTEPAGRGRAAVGESQPRAARDHRRPARGRARPAARHGATERRPGGRVDRGLPATMENAVSSAGGGGRVSGRVSRARRLDRAVDAGTRGCSSSSTRTGGGSASSSRTRR